ncbi:hypothetical protein N7513_011959 [Penicillium frequentans]|nr:hypothetical protein N7513_011959 [Penicillium glabrum]
MVGVGGRSKGCKTCRKRRVKCDERKPTCDRCHRAGKECEGYVRYIEFRDETARVARKQAPAQNATGQVSSPVSTASNSGSDESVIELPFTPLLMNPVWDEDSLFTTYLIDRIFTWHDDPTSPHSAGWIATLLRPREDEAALSSTSIRALATSYFAKMHGHVSLLQSGARQYSNALGVLQRRLNDSNLALEDDVLLAIICMSMYELVTVADPSAWVNHCKGLAQLTAIRGPYRHQAGVGHALLPTLRSTISIAYIVDRKRCFLEDPEWKTIPWDLKGLDSKIPIERLHDCLVNVPGIVEDMERLLAWDSDRPGRAEFKEKHCQQAFATLEGLYSWRWDWQREFPNATSLVRPIDIESEGFCLLPLSPFETVIWFDEHYRATELIVYNAIRLLLTMTLEKAGIDIETHHSFDGVNDPLLPMQGSRHEVAVEICRMSSFHLQSFHQSSGAFMLLFPLNVALHHLDGDKDGVRPWLQKVLAIIADMHGFEVGRRDFKSLIMRRRQAQSK